MKEYKEGVPFVAEMIDGTRKNIMFKRWKDYESCCKKCVFYHEGPSICYIIPCMGEEREDGLEGYYIEV